MTLEVAGEAPVAADPSEGTLDDPALGQHLEAWHVVALDDLETPGAGLGDGCRDLRPLIAAIGEDHLDEWEPSAGAAQQLVGAIAILHVAWMHHDAEDQAERVDHDVALAAGDLLARIEALTIDRGPPFCAALALWLSITAADGLASRPAWSRSAT